ncbi:hypothetical protein MFRU_026g00410 [Monilinia fructicola]|uniref:Uncharacterized protein n=1 Tax=Monilinia fructicola TaxID=38448 RepID=A0A5M9JS48_MONFR|nr:hypothetical protein EYC84_001431 [Monilinia fructicola]KAG4027859.1 hypothetical protein MFRU_026g00410 [Monilinia fructicola]
MSTVNNNSPSFRRRLNMSGSTDSGSSNPSPRKVITSRKPEPALPRSPKKPERLRPQGRFWVRRYLIETICSLWNVGIIRNGILITGLTLIVISILRWREGPSAKRVHSWKDEAPWDPKRAEASVEMMKPPLDLEIDDLAYENEESLLHDMESEDLIWRDPYPRKISPGELKSPLLRLTNINNVYYLDPLKVAYADIRYTINKLAESVPDISEHGPNLISRIKSFRNNAWKFSEVIGEHRKFTYQVVGRLNDWCKVLKKGLVKAKPKDTWKASDQSNSAGRKKIAEIWLYFFEALEKEVRNIHDKTYEFQMEVAEACQERRELQYNLRTIEPRMTKEAQNRNWDNFNFEKAYQLLQRLSGKSDGDTEGYEHVLLSRITDTQKALSTADSEIRSVIQKLQKSINQTEDVSATEALDFPPLDEQIKVIGELIEGFEREVAWIDGKKEELEKRLKGKGEGSQEKIVAYDYVLGGHDWEAERKKLAKQERESMLDHSWAPGSGPPDDYY